MKTIAIVELIALFLLLAGYGLNAYVARELHKLAVVMRDLTDRLVKIRPAITLHMDAPPIGHTRREIMRRAKEKGKPQ